MHCVVGSKHVVCSLQCSVCCMKYLHSGAGACAGAGAGAGAVCSVNCALCMVQCAACHKVRFRNLNRISQINISY